MVPRIIHYCWFGPNEKSILNNKCIQSWSKYLLDYKIVLWNESNSPVEHPYVRASLENGLFAFASDYVRLWALYNYGGIYFDTDMELIKDIEPIISNYDLFSGFEDDHNISCGLIGASEKNIIIEAMLRYIDEECVPRKHFIAIPKYFTPAYNNLKLANTFIFPTEYFYPFNPYDKNSDSQLMFSSIKPNTYAIHHWDKSWKEKKTLLTRLLRFIKRKLKFGWQVFPYVEEKYFSYYYKAIGDQK